MIEWITNNNLWSLIIGIGGAVVGGTLVAIRERIFAAITYFFRRRVEGTGRKEQSEHTKNDLAIVRELTNIRETLDKPAFIVLVEQTELDDKVKKSLIEGWSEKIAESGMAEPAATEENDQASAVSDSEQATDDSNWTQEVQQLLKDGKPDRADEVFQSFRKSSEKSEDTRRADSFYYQYLRYTVGQDETALPKMEQEVAESWNDDSYFYSLILLAVCYKSFNAFDRVEKLWREVAARTSDPKDKTRMLCELAGVLSETLNHDEAIRVMEKQLIVADSKWEKMRLYQSIASIENRRGNKETCDIAREKSLEFAPDDREKLFRTAFDLSSADMNILRFINYQTLLSLDPTNDMARNNYGIVLGILELPGMQIAAYELAAKEGNTLSMANISYEYIGAGFFEEARQRLEDANSQEDTHENVGKALYDLKEKLNAEQKKWAKLLERGLDYQQCCRRYAAALFDAKSEILWTEGSWITDNGYDVTLTLDGSQVTAKWQQEAARFTSTLVERTVVMERKVAREYSIEGQVQNRAARITYKEHKDLNGNQGLATLSLFGSGNVNIECFSYLSEDNSKWYIFAKDGQKDFKITLTREM